MVLHTCSVSGCYSKDVKVFHFPRTAERAEKWKQLCQEPALAEIPLQSLTQRACICAKHFTRDQFTNSLMDRLNRNAMPSLFLPSSSTPSTSMSHPPSSDKQLSPPASPCKSPPTPDDSSSQSESPTFIRKVNIREAEKSDCTEIQRLIQELAEYENMPYGPKLDSKVLEEDGFDSDHPSFGCFVIEDVTKDATKGKVFAYALYFIAYSSWQGKSMYLEDIYVTPDYRGQGLGTKLLGVVAQKGLELGCRRMDFRVMKWNPAVQFYKKKGAIDLTKMGGYHNFGIELGDMEKLADEAKY